MEEVQLTLLLDSVVAVDHMKIDLNQNISRALSFHRGANDLPLYQFATLVPQGVAYTRHVVSV